MALLNKQNKHNLDASAIMDTVMSDEPIISKYLRCYIGSSPYLI